MGEHLTTNEAAARLGVNGSRIRQLILAGQLRAKKYGPVWLVDEQALLAMPRRKAGRPRKAVAHV